MHFRKLALAALLLQLTACDRTPTELTLDEQQALLIAGETESLFAASPTSLTSLLSNAVARVERLRGSTAAARLLGGWQKLNHEAQQALRNGSRERAAKVAAVRTEEIRIVLQVLGHGTAQQVVRAVGLKFAEARLELDRAEQSGKNVARVRALASQVSERLVKANGALQARNSAGALDSATEASDLLDAMRRGLIALDAIPALDALFDEAMAKVAAEQSPETARALQSTLVRYSEEARVALHGGDRLNAQARLEAARREQTRLVLQVLGAPAVTRLTGQIEAALAGAKQRIAYEPNARVVQRGEGMLAEAASLSARARKAHAQGDLDTALDLASHAAGLLNALNLLIPR